MRIDPINTGKTVDGFAKKRSEGPPRGSSTQPTPAAPEPDAKSVEKDLIVAIEQANRTLQINQNRFNFSIHEATREIIVRIIDVETDEVIKEIPPEQLLDLVAKLWEMAGIVVDERR